MFAPTWNKYLPLIKIFLKRSGTGPQTVDMNRTDFERAAGGRKVKYTFSLSLYKGKIQNGKTVSPLAKELAVILQEDIVTRPIVKVNDYEFSMNSSFQLTIKNTTAAEETGDIEEQTKNTEEHQ